MLVFLYGSDAYRLKQAGDDIVNRYKTKYPSGMNLFAVNLSESDGMDVLESAIKSSSFFNEHKLIVCKNSFGKKTASELLAGYIKDFGIAGTSDITLISAETLAGKELETKNKELFKLLSGGKNMVKEFEPMQGEKLFEWTRKEFEVRGCSVEPNAVRNLVAMVGNDSWAVVNEIDKLASYKGHPCTNKDDPCSEVTSADIRELVHAKIDMNIFDLIDALGAKNRQRAVELLYRELKTGRDPYYILTMITYQFRNILTVKDLQKRSFSEAEIARKAKLNPFVVKKTVRSPFNMPESLKIYNSLLDIDSGFKAGQINLEDSLFRIIA